MAGSAVEPSLAIDWADRLITSGRADDALVQLSIALHGDERGVSKLVDAAWRALGVDLGDRRAAYNLLFDLLVSAIRERQLAAYELVNLGMLMAGDTFDDLAAAKFKVFYQVEHDLCLLLDGPDRNQAFDAADPAKWVLTQLERGDS